MQGTIIAKKWRNQNRLRNAEISQSTIFHTQTHQPDFNEANLDETNLDEITVEENEDNRFKSQLERLQKQHFTGRLDVDVQGKKWNLYLSLGRFAWASGGLHEQRRWRRQLIRTGIDQSIQARKNDRNECWDYGLLTLLSQRKLINKDQQITILRGTVTEILFEIVQAIELATLSQNAAHNNPKNIKEAHFQNSDGVFTLTPRLGVRPSHGDTGIFPRDWTLEVELALTMAERAWESWAKSGLALCSPNLAPVLKNREKLQAQVSPKIYQHLTNLINGKRTLRDLSVLMKQDILGVTRSLLPYIRNQAIGLVEIEDFPPSATTSQGQKKNPETPKTEKGDRGVVLCIDDSPQVCRLMEVLLTNAGYRVVTVQEAIKALPTLLECKPDAIFLDLIMPIANGYEICTQIRRIDRFKDTPIVILTGNDGFVDRVRAKMVGATDFLTKPIVRDRVLATVEKYVKA